MRVVLYTKGHPNLDPAAFMTCIENKGTRQVSKFCQSRKTFRIANRKKEQFSTF